MIKHVVMWKFKDEGEGRTREENLVFVRDSLYALTKIIPEIKKMEIGFDVSHTDMSADMMLVTEFDSVETMKIYAEHPEHKKVSVYVRRVVESRTVIDVEI